MVDLVIFDVDGTLVDSETKCLVALTMVVPELNMSVEELSRLYRGRKLTWIFEDISERLELQLPESIISDYRDAYTELVNEGLPAFPHVAETLTALSGPCCVASNAPLAKIDMNLVAAGLDQFFPHNARFSAYEVKAWKPDPKLFLEASSAHSVAASSCVVIEDSAAGIEASQAAGMTAVQFLEPGAQQICELNFSDYRELPMLLSSL